MAFELRRVVPWGRSFEEYTRMFELNEADWSRRILGCGDGPASFNAGATARGAEVVSCDPIYQLDSDQIRARFDETYDEMILQTRRNRDAFVWNEFDSPEDLGRARREALESFLDDFPAGRQRGRYIAAELPSLPFDDRAFDLALCSHFLFLYSDHLTEEFHVRSIVELARVAEEVRVFPLLTLEGAAENHLPGVLDTLERRGFTVRMERVPYEFVRGGNEMLRITRAKPK